MDQRAELVLGALACLVLALIIGMIVFVFQKAWPSFANNGLAWFGPGGNVDDQLLDIFDSPAEPADYNYELRAFPLIYATAVITFVSVAIGIVVATLSAIFIVEFAPGLDSPHPRAGRSPAGGGAVGDLRPDRDPGPGPVRAR